MMKPGLRFLLSVLFLVLAPPMVFAEELEWTTVFENSQARYSYEKGTVEILPSGVRVVFKTAPKDPRKWKGVHVLNTIALFNKKRQMKTIYSIGFDAAGDVVFEGNPSNPGWKSLDSGSAYEAIWKVVMRDSGILR